MQDQNPYAAPSANLGGRDSYNQGSGGVTQGVVEQLARTKGWTRFAGVMQIIGGSFTLLLVVIAGFAFNAFATMFAFPANFPLAVLYLFLGFYAVFGVIFLIAGVKLNGFSSSIQRLLFSGQESDLEDALDRQRGFWVYCGILAIIALLVFGIFFLGAIVAPFVSR